ncbi:hypothetical protein PF672P1_00070 [Parabacteroides phage PF672P1]|nr:hypothetical protein PF672P1_00070 [Parabacteroides phage PF672P1]
MMTPEQKQDNWLRRKIGVISASEVHLLMSKSGRWTKENLSFLYKIQRQRFLNEPSPQIKARNFELGHEHEPYAVKWLERNYGWSIQYASDMEEIPFIINEYGLGASPDAYRIDTPEREIIEIKTVIGATELNWLFSPTVPFDKKRVHVYDLHRDQMAGLLCTHPDVKTVYLVKYDPQLDDNDFDLRDAFDKNRGLVFTFTRDEMGSYLETLEKRVKEAEAGLSSGEDLEEYFKNL